MPLETTDATPDFVVEKPASPSPGHGLGHGFGPTGRIDGYEIQGLLGSGGMGEVYLARDPKLDRQVAIKVVRGEVLHRSSERLLREAQTMARLSHPNVVVCYQVGTVGAQVYLAMEYVEGETLRAWLRRGPHPWRDVLPIFIAAARGLAAAHLAGVVHRDFKPENVLVGRDGRVRVSDFGLAGDPGAGDGTGSGDLSSTDTVAFSGAAAGTPAYMSPEQHLREPLDARADQFAFCLTLYEALFGHRPFNGPTVRELRRQVLQQDAELPREGSVPAWVRAVVARGLRRDPAARFPSMEAVIAALEADPAVRRRRLGLVAGLALLGGLSIYGLTRRPPAAPSCDGGEARLAGVWDDAVKARVRERFLASGRSYAALTFDHVSTSLDGYTAAWRAMHRDACEATAVRHEQSAALLDRRMECLDRRLSGLRELVSLYAGRTEPRLVDGAVSAVGHLDDVALCGDVEALSSALPLPASPAQRDWVKALRGRLDRGTALLAAGQARPARAILSGVVTEARALAYPPALAEALLAAARADRTDGAFALAEARLREGVEESARARSTFIECRSQGLLLYVVGVDAARVVEAQAMIPSARAAALRAGNDPTAQAGIYQAIGAALMRGRELEGARTSFDQALRIAVAAKGHDSFDAGSYRNDLAILLRRTGQGEESVRLLVETRDAWKRSLGPDHPSVAGVSMNLCTSYLDLRQFEAARAECEASVESFRRAYGEDNINVGRALNALAQVLMQAGTRDEALVVLRRSLAAKEKAVGPDHLELATTLINIANLLHLQGKDEEALVASRRALALREKALGPRNKDVAESLVNLAQTLTGLGRLPEAHASADRALAILLEVTGKEGVAVGEALVTRSRLELLEGDAAAALADAERGLRAYAELAGVDDRLLSDPHAVRGAALLALARPREAAADLDLAVRFHSPLALEPLARLQTLQAQARVAAATVAPAP